MLFQSVVILHTNYTVTDSYELLTYFFFLCSIAEEIPMHREVEPLLELDQDQRSFAVYLTKHTPVLTAGDLRRFLPCTCNLDPYLRKQIRGMYIDSWRSCYLINLPSSFSSSLVPPPPPPSFPLCRHLSLFLLLLFLFLTQRYTA